MKSIAKSVKIYRKNGTTYIKKSDLNTAISKLIEARMPSDKMETYRKMIDKFITDLSSEDKDLYETVKENLDSVKKNLTGGGQEGSGDKENTQSADKQGIVLKLQKDRHSSPQKIINTHGNFYFHQRLKVPVLLNNIEIMCALDNRALKDAKPFTKNIDGLTLNFDWFQLKEDYPHVWVAAGVEFEGQKEGDLTISENVAKEIEKNLDTMMKPVQKYEDDMESKRKKWFKERGDEDIHYMPIDLVTREAQKKKLNL